MRTSEHLHYASPRFSMLKMRDIAMYEKLKLFVEGDMDVLRTCPSVRRGNVEVSLEGPSLCP